MKRLTPPRFWARILTRGVRFRYHEEFLGDLQELYEDRLLAKGRRYARMMYGVDALHLFFGFSKLWFSRNRNNFMIKNLVTITWRHAMRQKESTLLNVLGLTLGITACMLISLFVYQERSYDNFHVKGDRIYRVNQPLIWRNWDWKFASTGPNVALALEADIPEFEALTRLYDPDYQTVRVQPGVGDYHLLEETKFFGADANFLSVFTFPLIQGNAATALQEPFSVVLTEETAEAYFGQKTVLGRSIEVRQQDGTWDLYTVTGVAANVPENSHIQFNVLYSMSSMQQQLEDSDWKWIWTAFSTYGLVREGTDIAQLEEKIQAVPPKWAAATTERIFNQTFEEYCAGKEWTLYLQPLQDIYLDEQPYTHRFGPSGTPLLVWIFSSLAVLILVLSSINFMNLSTARSSIRAKEVGVRKVLGSRRGTLVYQFVFESFVYVLVCTLLALVFSLLLLDGFNTLTDRQLSFVPLMTRWQSWAVLMGFVAFLGLLAGSYPAFYLSSFRPAQALKGKVKDGFRGKGLRNGLVVTQFTLSIGLVICAVFVQKQLAHTSAMDLGLSRENVLRIHNLEQLGEKAEYLKNEWASHPAVSVIGKSHSVPPNVWEGERYKTHDPEQPVMEIANMRVDREFVEVLDLEFVSGRNFDANPMIDRHHVILNEAAVKALGWGTAEDYAMNPPVGKQVIQAFDEEHELEVIGVVKDFNFITTQARIGPLMLLHYENDWFWNYSRGPQYLSMRLNPDALGKGDGLPALLAGFEQDIREIDASVLFQYTFIDEEFDQSFRQERRMAKVLNVFTGIALVIACLGLFGLATFSADQRTKEIGIRKVLGAKVGQLLYLFSAEFTRLILLAIVLASGLAWWAVDQWLAKFVYHTTVEVWVFLMAAVASMALALGTIAYQALVAAFKNPVDTLKDE